jgi:hypothetical protein
MLFTLYLVLFRLRIYLTSTMFQIYGMFPLFLEWVSTFSLRLSVDHLEETIEFMWIVFGHCSCTRLLTCAVFQNQKAHEAIIKQLNLSRWVRQLWKSILMNVLKKKALSLHAWSLYFSHYSYSFLKSAANIPCLSSLQIPFCYIWCPLI